SGDKVSLRRIYSGTAPTMIAPNDTLQFVTVVGDFKEASVEVQAWNLTGSISVTVPAPFQVSIDGFTYTTTVTIPANGGMLYIKYIPTVEGNHSGLVTLSATGVPNITIPVMGASVNCGTISFPYVEDFTTLTGLLCWSVIDANEDDNTFVIVPGGAIYEYSANAANDWLVSPKLTIPAEASLNFQAACYSGSYPEKFSVYVMNDINNYANATRVLGPVTLDIAQWQDFYVNLTPFAGQQIYVGIKCESDADMYAFMVRNIEFNNYVGIETQTQDVVSVYPNPASNVVNVTAPSTIKMVEVFNITGQSILSNQVGDT
ncbi:MAG: choice-of-anchor J domain-containing protein, partial [Bacteroidales bacterium]